MKLIYLVFLWLLPNTLIASSTECGPWSLKAIKKNGPIVRFEKTNYFSKEELSKKIPTHILGEPQNGVFQYAVDYWSHTPSGSVLVSGVINAPDSGNCRMPWVGLQHGTIIADSSAPSRSNHYGLADAAMGFVTVVPDYVGYGASSHMWHPYHIESYYGPVVTDALKFTKIIAAANGVQLDQLFLRGYSEGGYATLATQKFIEAERPHLASHLVASAPSAGAYDVLATGFGLLKAEYTNPVNLLYIIFSYSEYYPNEVDINTIVPAEIAAFKPQFMGDTSYEDLSEKLPKKTAQLIRHDFRQNFLANVAALLRGEKVKLGPVEKMLLANSIHQGWKVKTPVKFYHCIDDQDVPIISTEQALKGLGVDNPNVKVERIPSPTDGPKYNHTSCPATFSPILWFKALLKN